MIRRRWAVALLGLAACAPATREARYTHLAERSDGLCWWSGARWEDGTLLARSTGEPFARARAQWQGEVFRGARVSGVLRKAGSAVVFQGEWVGEGLTLRADVDVTAQAAFRTFTPTRLDAAGLLLKGSHVRVLDAQLGKALVSPSTIGLRPFRSATPPVLELPCDQLALTASLDPPTALQQLERAGFPTTATPVTVPAQAVVPAALQPGGQHLGVFVGNDSAQPGFVVARRDEHARLVVPSDDGLVWVGWVNAAALGPAAERSPRAANSQVRPEGTAQVCPGEVLTVSIESEGQAHEAGQLAAGTQFTILGERFALLEARVAVGWLELMPGHVLLLPVSAARCERVRPLNIW